MESKKSVRFNRWEKLFRPRIGGAGFPLLVAAIAQPFIDPLRECRYRNGQLPCFVYVLSFVSIRLVAGQTAQYRGLVVDCFL